MSKIANQRERSSAMNHIALAQNVLGQGLRMANGILGGEEEQPTYIIDDAPVFMCGAIRLNTSPISTAPRPFIEMMTLAGKTNGRRPRGVWRL